MVLGAMKLEGDGTLSGRGWVEVAPCSRIIRTVSSVLYEIQSFGFFVIVTENGLM